MYLTRNGEDVFRGENIVIPILTTAVAVAISTPVTVEVFKWIGDA